MNVLNCLPAWSTLTMLLLILTRSGPAAHAQGTRADSSSITDEIAAILEHAAEFDSGDVEYLIRELRQLEDQPVNINTGTIRDLQRLPMLTPLQAARIIRFRALFGSFHEIDELRAVEGLPDRIVDAMRPYILTGRNEEAPAGKTPGHRNAAPNPERTLHGRLIQTVGRRIDLGRGYSPGPDGRPVYRGSPVGLTTRLRLRYGETVTGRLTIDQDPAEPLYWNPSDGAYGFDFWSGHLALERSGKRLHTLVVGDFVPAFGQGLMFSAGSGIGSSFRRPVRSVLTRRAGIRPYGSSGESSFFRGAAATVRVLPSLHATAFASRRRIDASLTVDGRGRTAVSRRVDSGYHRTRLEQSRRDLLGEVVTGAGIAWQAGHGKIGLSAYRAAFSHPFAAGSAPDDQFDFRGSTAVMAGIFGEWVSGRIHGFGEIARAPGGAFGGVGGIAAELAPAVEGVVVVRRYPRDFSTLYGHPHGRGKNETGVYTALRVQRFEAWDIAATFDQYRQPWLGYNLSRPTTGHTAAVSIAFKPLETVELHGRFRSRVHERASASGYRSAVIRHVSPQVRQSIRLQGSYRPRKNLRLRSRVEIVRGRASDLQRSSGTLFLQDIRWLPAPSIRIDARVTLFDSDAYAARLYAYENDLLYSFSVPVLDGRGQRAYVLGSWEVTEATIFQVKYAVSRYVDRESVGTGWNEVPGNRLSELRFQVRFRW